MRRRSFFGLFFSFVSITNWLIIINTIVFILFLIGLKINPGFLAYVELQPASILLGKKLWTLFTSMFIHQGGLHLFVNMFSLYFLGNLTERIIGRKRFVVLYLAAGLFAGLAFTLGAYAGSFFTLGSSIFGGLNEYAAGASGALFGLLGVLAVLIPYSQVSLIAGPLIVLVVQTGVTPFISQSIQGVFSFAMTILMLISLFALFSRNPKFKKLALPVAMPLWLAPIIAIVPLVLLSFVVSLPIGNSAHLGGLIVGLLYGYFLRKSYPKKVEALQGYFRK